MQRLVRTGVHSEAGEIESLKTRRGKDLQGGLRFGRDLAGGMRIAMSFASTLAARSM